MKSAADYVSPNLNMENDKPNKNLFIEHAKQSDTGETRIHLAEYSTPTTVNHAAVQCEMPLKKNTKAVKFDITEDNLRRGLVRRLYCVVVLQQLISIFFIKVGLICFDNKFPKMIYPAVLVLVVVIYALFYIFKSVRRPAPFNYMALAVAILINAGQEGIYATLEASQWALLAPLALIFEMAVLIAYTNCTTRLKFTIFRGILLMCVLIAAAYCVSFFVLNAATLSSLLTALCVGLYILYDTQLMLTGYHGYNLRPHEHIYAAANLYADFPMLCWRIFRWLCLAHIIGIYRFLRTCCRAEVC